MDRLLKLQAVCDATTLGSSTIYRHIEAGTFPKPRRVAGTSRVAWRESDIVKWIKENTKEAA